MRHFSEIFLGTRDVKEKILIIAAHPDDEIIGAASRLPRWKNVEVACVTNGSPQDLGDANHAGFQTREEYAAARREESLHALELAGVRASQVTQLHFDDQATARQLPHLTSEIVDLLDRVEPYLIVTHPYEGGHPDHDSVAFAVQTACELLTREIGKAPFRFEMSSYHNNGGCFQPFDFLPAPSTIEFTVNLSAKERELKAEMFKCFITQQRVIAGFPIGIEKFRAAPIYDFALPPHSGQLYYEMFPWGMTGKEWRQLAKSATRQLSSNRLPQLELAIG